MPNVNAEFVIDLDMVLADFVQATGTVFGRDASKISKWAYYEDWSLDHVRFWQRIHAYGERFYGEMVPVLPWAKTLMHAVGDNFRVMSAPGDPRVSMPVDWSAKWLWLSKYFPEIPATKLIVGFCKEVLAKPNVMLIDDSQDGCDKFAVAGGAVCLFPQRWNSNADRIDKRLEYATECIAKHKEQFGG
jgi:5'(3')-deoxyribonucleotidase